MFTDKAGREIEVATDDGDDDVRAYHNCKEIARFEIGSSARGPILLSMNVDSDYRRAGIGSELMKCVVDIHGKGIGKPRFTDLGGFDARSEDYYTEEGAAFVSHCVKQGILIDTDLYPGESLPNGEVDL